MIKFIKLLIKFFKFVRTFNLRATSPGVAAAYPFSSCTLFILFFTPLGATAFKPCPADCQFINGAQLQTQKCYKTVRSMIVYFTSGARASWITLGIGFSNLAGRPRPTAKPIKGCDAILSRVRRRLLYLYRRLLPPDANLLSANRRKSHVIHL